MDADATVFDALCTGVFLHLKEQQYSGSKNQGILCFLHDGKPMVGKIDRAVGSVDKELEVINRIATRLPESVPKTLGCLEIKDKTLLDAICHNRPEVVPLPFTMLEDRKTSQKRDDIEGRLSEIHKSDFRVKMLVQEYLDHTLHTASAAVENDTAAMTLMDAHNMLLHKEILFETGVRSQDISVNNTVLNFDIVTDKPENMLKTYHTGEQNEELERCVQMSDGRWFVITRMCMIDFLDHKIYKSEEDRNDEMPYLVQDLYEKSVSGGDEITYIEDEGFPVVVGTLYPSLYTATYGAGPRAGVRSRALISAFMALTCLGLAVL